jgi:hypothetical protein
MRRAGKMLTMALQIEEMLKDDVIVTIVGGEVKYIKNILDSRQFYCIFTEAYNSEKHIVGYNIKKMTFKEKQEYLISKIMEDDQKLGLYEN